jgi:MFS transporter, PAT family, beta-lactamase induction signal transducer AmpG
MATSAFPALSESRKLRFATVSLLYVAQGLPFGLFTYPIPAWLTEQGASQAQSAAFMSISFLPWAFKFLVAPFMDVVAFRAMGRRRPWIIGAQVGLVLALLGLAASPDPLNHLGVFTALAFCVSLFAATQDVAVDGMSIDILREDERARANALMFGAQVLGIAAGSAGGGYAIHTFGMYAAPLALAFCSFLIMLVPLLLRERPGERLLPWTEGSAAPSVLDTAGRADLAQIVPMARELLQALFLPMSLMLFAIHFMGRTGGGVYLAVMGHFPVEELGWSSETYAYWSSAAQVTGAIGGIAGAALVDRFGVRRVLGVLIGARVALYALAGLQTMLLQNYSVMTSLMLVEYVMTQTITVSIIALFMSLCMPRVAATQFSLYMASANLAQSAGQGLTAALAPLGVGAPGLFLLMAGLNAAMLALWPLFSLEKHRAKLDRSTLATPIPPPQDTVPVV